MQLPLNVSPVSASFFGLERLGIHLVLCVACSSCLLLSHASLCFELLLSTSGFAICSLVAYMLCLLGWSVLLGVRSRSASLLLSAKLKKSFSVVNVQVLRCCATPTTEEWKPVQTAPFYSARHTPSSTRPEHSCPFDLGYERMCRCRTP